MSDLVLKAAIYTKLPHPLFEPRRSVEATFDYLCQVVTRQRLEVSRSQEEVDGPDSFVHFLCSTIIEVVFASGDITWQTVRGQFSRYCRSGGPTTFVNAYECASWGYALRHMLLGRTTDVKNILITVLDANIYNMKFWEYNSNWGNSGFGMTTFLIERSGSSAAENVFTGCSTSSNAMQDFAFWVKKISSGNPEAVVVLPFFPSQISRGLSRILSGSSRLPDLHDQWGHCFGSDPWVSLIAESVNPGFDKGRSYLLCSHALNGYHVACKINVAEDAELRFGEVKNDVSF
ncbi:MAG: hypothetical protein HQK54_13445 [Oligoflexales bacterium]|nr:hypothetical protein [Oligoflexales bacterium]